MNVPTLQSLDQVAETYVRLTLALGEIDPYHVDAYFGPPAWKDEAKGTTLDEIVARSAEARAAIGQDEIKANRRARFLDKQLQSLIARAQLRNGVRFSFDEESAAIYDVVAPTFPDTYYGEIVKKLEPLLPGDGTLSENWEAIRSQFYVPAEKVKALFTAGVDIARERTRKYIHLPANESFEIELVSGQVWVAYNWYKGDSHSLIQVNTDLPMSINRFIHLACHEGYPGHHVYNVLLEQKLVKVNNWVEFSIYPLYSPESLIAEGTAEYGAELCFSPEDKLGFEQDVLYPMAGLDSSRAAEFNHILALMDQLGNATNDAGRRYLDGKLSREETIDWLQTYSLANPKRAEQNIAFFDTHRSYTVTYDVGEEMVKRYVESKAKTTEDKWKVFTDLLSAPTVPSDLLA